MLRVTEKSGFGARVRATGEEGVINLSITAGTHLKNYNVFDQANSVGNPTADVTDGVVRVFLGNLVSIGSTSTGAPGFTSGLGWGTGWIVEVVVEGTNTARVGGMGGEGGRGVEFSFGGDGAKGGGGGGGGGDDVGDGGDGGGDEASTNGQPGTATAGGVAGITNFTDPGQERSATGGANGGPAMEATADCDIDLVPESGATLEVWGGGGGGDGDDGSGPGDGGAPANASPKGGTAGASYIGAGTVTEVGPGAIDTDGP